MPVAVGTPGAKNGPVEDRGQGPDWPTGTKRVRRIGIMGAWRPRGQTRPGGPAAPPEELAFSAG